jgi:hypothetical protein
MERVTERHDNLNPCNIVYEVWCTRNPFFKGERFNVFSHLVGFIGFMCWGILNLALMHTGSAAVFQSLFLFSLALVYAVSTMYHTYVARKLWSKWLRVMDYLCIYISMCLQSVFIIQIVSEKYPKRQIHWQSFADLIIAVSIVIVATVGRELDVLFLNINTYVKMEPCDPCRYAHVDGVHTLMRLGINSLFVSQWILYVAIVYDSLAHPYNLLLIFVMGGTSIIIAMTQVNDYYNITSIFMKKCPYPHGIFHVSALVCTVLIAATNEIVLRL